MLSNLVVEMCLVPTAPPLVRHFALLLRKVRPVRCEGSESVGVGTPVLALAARSEAFPTERAQRLGGGRPIHWRVCALIGHCVDSGDRLRLTDHWIEFGLLCNVRAYGQSSSIQELRQGDSTVPDARHAING